VAGVKAMVLKEFGKPLSWEEVPEPTVGPRQALVQAKANGLCATDLKIVDGLVKSVKTPLRLGHESAGVVVEVGSEVEAVRPGDRVVMVCKQTCGGCRMCRAGHEEMCLHSPGRMGFEIDGGFGELVAVPERNLVRVGPQVSLEAASLMGGTLGSPLHAIRMARVELGETAVVFGLGGLGIHALQVLRHLGASVIGVDVREDALAKARELGAGHTINARQTDPVQAVRGLTGGLGADLALEIVGGDAVPPVIQQCLDLLRPGGRLVILGYHYGQAVPLDPAALVYRWIHIIASHNHSVRDVEDAASLVNDGRVRAIVADTAPMREANHALARLRAGDPVGRIVLQW
jgi:propanol-preferring alcohol dehydrogenase